MAENSRLTKTLEYMLDLQQFAEEQCKIRAVDGGIVPLKFNKAQIYTHQMLEKQKADTGKVRAIILKGRQQGLSTYVSARYYHQVINNIGQKCMILTHLDAATNNLFNMAKRIHENVEEEYKPKAHFDNAKELYFKSQDAGYKVGTAGNKNVGRSDTIQLLHASEVAFWRDDYEVVLSALQAVPSVEGSEIILESTANGVNNMFHDKAMEAIDGKSEFQLIFIPWFWEDRYRAFPPADYEPGDEEVQIAHTYGLDLHQLYWRKLKIKEVGSVGRFKQEYPNNPVEAFQSSGKSFIAADIVAKKMAGIPFHDTGFKEILGVDPAGMGADDTAFVWRRGRDVTKFETYSRIDHDAIIGLIVREIKTNPNLVKVCIDVCGSGYEIDNRLKKAGFGGYIIPVNVGKPSIEPAKYFNLRAQLWDYMRLWIEDDCYLPKDTMFLKHLTMLKQKDDLRRTATGQLLIQMQAKKELTDSPDLADALALTFAISGEYATMPINVPNYDVRANDDAPHFLDW